MKKQSLFLILMIFLTSCASVQTLTTPTFAPSATPIPSATATPVPTVTNTPTEVPIPVNEYQVIDADGNTLIVVNGQLFKWEKGTQTSMAIENVIFDNAIDASNIAGAMGPEAYFDVESGQQALRDILLPNGIAVNQKFKYYVDDFVLNALYGVPVSFAKVDAGNSDVAVVMNMAVVGGKKPVPVIIGKIDNGNLILYDQNWIPRFRFSDDPSKAAGYNNGLKADKITSMSDLKAALIGYPVQVRIDENLNENGKIEGNPYFVNVIGEFYNRIIQKYIDVMITANGIKPVPQDGITKYGAYLNRIMETLSNQDFDGFVPKSSVEKLVE